jgi:putative endonuclease
MYKVYVLRDDCGKLYKGVTNNLERRLKEHRSGSTRTTRKMDNIVVVYTEGHDTFKEARARELYLKSAAGRRFLKKVLGY